MFEDKDLQNFLETSSTIRNKSVITAEWNMNIPTNIKHIGNYRYRPTQSGSIYASLPTSFDINDAGNFYTGATDADVVVDGVFDNDDIPTILLNKKEKISIIWSSHDLDAVERLANKVACLNKTLFFHGISEDFFSEFSSPNMLYS